MKSVYYGVLFVLLLFYTSTLYAKGSSKTIIYQGWLSAYDKGPTDHTLDYRLSTGAVQEGYDVYIAVPECSRIGETGIIIFSDNTRKTYQVFDCASRAHYIDGAYQWMIQNNIIAEIDYYSWKEHGLGRAKLVLDNPPKPARISYNNKEILVCSTRRSSINT